MTDYGYEIEPRPADLGGGWRLRLLENGEEVGGGVFPLSPYLSAFPATDETNEREMAAKVAYEDALAEASAWLATRPADEEPAFLDDEGPSDDLPTRITLPKS
ncbi:hypothetical protein EV683_1451 [Crenobacter luteus]|uniref:hypothetical protein n=1 Tax=Crenobacter luteus TaxID=1452487 RepID=UPI001052BF84|nr:hypothetical protein [Crenobacter luteus]TCP07374.1 hypothetical protein EV683_1451 [Crenobacter luteus]